MIEFIIFIVGIVISPRVYVEDKIDLAIVQQPPHQSLYVSTEENSVTEYQIKEGNSLVLLAHNYLAGEEFHELKIGDKVIILDQFSRRVYIINQIDIYQRIPEDWILIDQNQNVYTEISIARQYYWQENKITFQTCYEKNGNESWGLIFISGRMYTKEIYRGKPKFVPE